MKRFGTPFDGPVVPILCRIPNLYETRKSFSIYLVQRCLNVHRIPAEISNLVITDWHDIENNVVSEVHFERSNAEKLESTNCKNHSHFFAQTVPYDR